jgi:hypothetical protein
MFISGKRLTHEAWDEDHNDLDSSNAASLRGKRLKRKSSEPHVLRNGRERGDQTYLGEKLTIQCLDVKVVLSQ